MADRDVEFSITATNKSGPAVEGAADGLERLGHEADKAKRKVDNLGDQTGQLARKMLEARVAAAGLARQFDKTGDSKLLKDFDKHTREAQRLGRALKAIEPPKLDPVKGKDPASPGGIFGTLVEGARKAGILAGDAAVDGIGDVFKAMPTEAKAAIAGGLGAAVIVAAPAIVAALDGAVLAGLGGGGIAAGLILGAKDARVAQAYTRLGNVVLTELESAARPFADTLVASAPRLESAFDQETPRIRNILSNLATGLTPLITAGIMAVHEILPAIDRAAPVAALVIRSIASEIPYVAAQVANLIDAFAAGGPGAATAMAMLVQQIGLLIQVTAFAVRQVSPFVNLLGIMARMAGQAPESSHAITGMARALDGAGHSAGLTAEQYAMLSGSLEGTATQADLLNSAFSRLFNEQMGVDEANLAVNLGLQRLTSTIQGNKKSLDETTQSGAENARVILAQVQNYEQQRQAAIAAGNGTVEASQQANAAYVAQLEGLRKVLYNLGLNHAEVDKLINAYEALAQPQTKYFTTVYRDVYTSGYSDVKTGHSRTGGSDYSGLSGWAPAAFAAGERAAYAATPEGGGHGPTMPPVQVHSEHSLTVLLDGAPFKTIAYRTTSAAEKRAAWRQRVGRR